MGVRHWLGPAFPTPAKVLWLSRGYLTKTKARGRESSPVYTRQRYCLQGLGLPMRLKGLGLIPTHPSESGIIWTSRVKHCIPGACTHLWVSQPHPRHLTAHECLDREVREVMSALSFKPIYTGWAHKTPSRDPVEIQSRPGGDGWSPQPFSMVLLSS